MKLPHLEETKGALNSANEGRIRPRHVPHFGVWPFDYVTVMRKRRLLSASFCLVSEWKRRCAGLFHLGCGLAVASLLSAVLLGVSDIY